MGSHVLDGMAETVRKFPNKIAFADEVTEYTFAQVDDISKRIGSYLAHAGFYREPVAILMKKSPRTIVSFFGVIRGGCYYVPLDEEMPVRRIELILGNCKPRILICDEYTEKLAKSIEYDGTIVNFCELENETADEMSLIRIRQSSIDTDPIYIVFTSGSTGIPKGVCACHRSVLDYVEQLSKVLHFDCDTVFGNQTPLYFDACLKEIFPTIYFGATTYLIPKKYFMFPVKLVHYLNEKKINTLCWVVSALTLISSVGTLDKIRPQYVKMIAFGSEVFPIPQFKLWRDALPETEFVNLYGPTEGTGMCCYYPVKEMPEDGIPIGYPFANTRILLLREDGMEAVGEEYGEICICGTSVTLGYYNNPEKTKESFVQNPLNPCYPEVIYRTGDLGRRNERGELIFLSRKDYQIKHMGHRIELGEIESAVHTLEDVHLCACVYNEVTDKICLFFTGEKDEAEVSRELRELLPRYMLPNHTCRLDEMLFTPNGKINRTGLKELALKGIE